MNLTLLADASGVYRMELHEPNVWPAHRADRLITEAEHGHDLYFCWPHDFMGDAIEMQRHLWDTVKP